DTPNPQLDFQRRVIDAVAKVTHIAPADAKGQIIGSDVVSPGVILYPFKALGLCAGLTDAPYTTTTEVYPDSPRATPEQCVDAQVASVVAAIDVAVVAAG
ncbi:MAG: peptidase, partial [Lysobacteraceae bacterium]